MTRCQQCGTENRPGARFCTKCGAALPVPTLEPDPTNAPTRISGPVSAPGSGPASAAPTAAMPQPASGRPLSSEPSPASAPQPASGPGLLGASPVCPHCGVPLRPNAQFCPACGHALGAPGVPATQKVGADARKEARLVVRWPGGRTEGHALTRAVMRVGRSPDNDITLDFPTVSSHHLRLNVAPGGVQVTDLHSTNGTLLRGELIPSDSPQLWRPGDILRVGDLRGNSISMVLESSAGPSLHTYPLGMHRLAQYPTIVIGRDPASQITLDHPTISRRHAEIARQSGGGHALRDLGSVNGTFLNGQRVGDWTPLRMGDVIQLGPYKMVYDGQAERLSTSVSQGHRLDGIGLGVQVAGGRMILQDISVSVQGSEFVALVGGSGAGKSTLLKAMNGFHPATHGQMLIDGEPLYPNLGAYRTLMGYVPQDDIIHRTLPVHTALWYSAKLRLPDATPAEIEARIQDVLGMVDMEAHAGKPVKVLSGGQRKRVSIAVELLAEPDLLFLDEPTSGLDPGLEKKMMYDLNRLADQGRTVVLVTHATANIEQCDHVAFLVRGNLAYYGPPRDAMTFFQARDFADIYLKLSEEVDETGSNLPTELVPYYRAYRQAHQDGGANGQVHFPAGLLWAQHYRTSPIYRKFVADRQAHIDEDRPTVGAEGAKKPRRAHDSGLRQLFILARRQFDLIRHDMRTLFILLLMMPLIGMLFMVVSEPTAFVGRPGTTAATLKSELLNEIGIADEEDLRSQDVELKREYIPLQDASNLVTMLGLALTQAGTFGAAYEIVKERPIFRREKSVNLRVGAYVLSKALVLGAFAVIQVASVLLVLSLKLDMNFSPAIDAFPSGGVELFVTLLIAVFASIMFGLFISAIVPSPDVVLYFILVQLFTQIILSGTMFPLENNPASKLVASYWTMDAMGATVDLQRMNDESVVCKVWEQADVPLPDGSTTTQRGIECNTAARDELSLPYEHTPEHLLTTWAALGAQALVWGLATVIVQSRVKGD